MTELKSSVFEGLVLVLSGLVPLGVKVEDSEVGGQALSFGAQILDEVSGLATHLVVATSRPRTKKVQQAAKIPSIRIVNQNWLTDCLSQWRRLNEGPYLMNVHDAPQRREDVSDVVSEDDGDINAANLDVESDWELGAFEEADELLNGDSSSDDDDEEGDNDSDRSDSEMGETGSVKSGSGSKGVKRKTLASTDESDTESVLAKKQRLARSRGASTLRSVRTPNGAAEEDADDAVHSSLPTPGPTGDEEDEGGNPANLDNGDDFDEDQLEADLLAEFEAEDA
jgi:RNA polymerase II subunit A-like phosphatase